MPEGRKEEVRFMLLLSSKLAACWIWHSSLQLKRVRCRGFIGPIPSTSLNKIEYVVFDKRESLSDYLIKTGVQLNVNNFLKKQIKTF